MKEPILFFSFFLIQEQYFIEKNIYIFDLL